MLQWVVVIQAIALAAAVRQIRGLRIAHAAHDMELAQLRRLTLVDSLTGLRNRRAFDEELQQALLTRARGAIEPRVALAMIDLRGLKEINDTVGHQAGDARLVTLAETLRAGVRGGDAVYRLGGDEFMVILPGQSAQAAKRLMMRLNTALSEQGLSVCAGVAEASDSVTSESLIGRADRALIAAKHGPEAVVVWQPGLDRMPRRQLPVEEDSPA